LKPVDIERKRYEAGVSNAWIFQLGSC